MGPPFFSNDPKTLEKKLKILERIISFQFIYSLAGLTIGSLCLVLGTFLLYSGVVGSTSWTANILGFASELSDAGPGLVIALIGLFIIFITRFGIKVTKQKN
jgi:hypothetical protein